MPDEYHEKLERKVAELEAQIHDLEKDLIHDSLTGLKTKAFFEEETTVFLHAISNLEAGKRREWFGFKTLSFIFFDIDNFKKINDTYGHPTGDEILREVSLLINRSVREGDTVARFGGEEIVACLLGANEQDAKDKAQSIIKTVERLTFTNDVLKVTISAGVATNWKDATYSELIERADKALYSAKETGKNKVVAFSELQ
jgi:two-component system cell cycle response regulator